MLDVLFVMPSTSGDLALECLGTLLLATILKEKKINTQIYRLYDKDAPSDFNTFVDDAVAKILEKEPKIVSFYCRCDCFLANVRIAEKLKEKNPNIIIVFAGPQADASCIETLTEFEWVDYCCCGEGETTIYPLFSGLLSGEDVASIDGLVYRNENGEIVCNPRPEFIKNLDDVPFIDYSFLPKETINKVAENKTAFSIEVGRGCPFNCAFCSTKNFWKRTFRVKSPQRIVDEMKYVNEQFGIKKFVFEHDLFTASKKNILEFCNLLKNSNLDFNWACSSRIDTLDEEMMDAMVDAGLKSIYFGVESGSERMQKIIHKNLKNEDVLRVCKYLIDRNVIVTASFIYGFPEETKEDLDQTLQLMYELIKMSVNYMQFHLCAIFPKTEYFEKYKSELVFSEHFSDQVVDFGIKENMEFVTSHMDLFPFYYEYQSEHRKRYAELTKVFLSTLNFLKQCETLCGDVKNDISLSELCLAFAEGNMKNLSEMPEDEQKKTIRKILTEYIYGEDASAENIDKMSEIIRYNSDVEFISRQADGYIDVKSYSVDVKSYASKVPFSEIEAKDVFVYFRRNGKDIEQKYRILTM